MTFTHRISLQMWWWSWQLNEKGKGTLRGGYWNHHASNWLRSWECISDIFVSCRLAVFVLSNMALLSWCLSVSLANLARYSSVFRILLWVVFSWSCSGWLLPLGSQICSMLTWIRQGTYSLLVFPLYLDWLSHITWHYIPKRLRQVSRLMSHQGVWEATTTAVTKTPPQNRALQ